jgi:predicted DNA-binding transcriptional regulator
MTQTFNLEGVDLAAMVSVLRRACGSSVMGAVVGRTRLRDEITHQLGCSLLMGEMIIDTMISRGFIRQHVHPDGWVYWEMLNTGTPEGP